jgi:hypothetical protein
MTGKGPNRRRLVALAALLASAVLIGLALERVLGGADGDGLVRPRGNSSLTHARAFGGHPLYFAGDAVLGHGLEAVVRIDRTSPARHTEFRFLYGACRARSDQGCGVPLVILLWPACYRYETRYSIPPRQRRTIRGVPARVALDGSRLELYPARTTIVVQGAAVSSRADLLAVARQLRGLNVPLRAGAPLPPRPPHAGRTLRCRSRAS